MKILNIQSGYHQTAYHISDDAKADAAYAKIKAALETHKEYGNDKDKTVTVETDVGEMTFRLGHGLSGGLSAVAIEALGDKLEEVVREMDAWKSRFKDLDKKEARP